MQPILGKNGYIEFYKENDYRPFVCCESLEISFSGEEKSVKTIGDGVWKRSRLQSLGYTISISGLIPYDDEPNVNTFDLLDYLMNMVDISFQVVFEDITGATYKVIRGIAGVRTLGISSPQDFVAGTIELTGQGKPEITNVADVCLRTIPSGQVVAVQQPDHRFYHITVQNITGGQVGRYDYQFDNGPIQTSLGGDWALPDIVTIGSHTLNIWPVCDNGIYGDLYTLTINRIS